MGVNRIGKLISKNAPPELARLITGKEAPRQLAQKTPSPAAAPSTEKPPATAEETQQAAVAKPVGREDGEAIDAASETGATPSAHSAALPPKRPDTQLARLPTPKLPPAQSAPGPTSSVGGSVTSNSQSGGLLTTLKSLFGPAPSEDTETGERETLAQAQSTPPAPSNSNDSTGEQIAAIAPAVAPETAATPVKPVSVVPVSSILDAGLIAYRARDYRTALTNWLPLAQQGNDNAQFFVGGLYADGAGVPRDVVRAHVSWSLASASGHETAVQFLENLKIEMEPDQIVAASLLAKNFNTNP